MKVPISPCCGCCSFAAVPCPLAVSPIRRASSGRWNAAGSFSPELADLTIYVIDVAEGEKIPRKGGPGITRSDLLVINKIDPAPYVGASLEVMEADTKRMRGVRPFVFSNLKTGQGLDETIGFIRHQGMLDSAAAANG